MGGQVPDLRGLFLRGQGGKSEPLGVKQEDAGRNITGTFSSDALFTGLYGDYPTGAFFMETKAGGHISSVGQSGREVMKLDASRGWGSAHTTDAETGEFRPVNVSVRYLIRARP